MPKRKSRIVPKKALAKIDQLKHLLVAVYCFSCRAITFSKSSLIHPTCAKCHRHKTARVDLEASE